MEEEEEEEKEDLSVHWELVVDWRFIFDEYAYTRTRTRAYKRASLPSGP